MSDGAEVAMIDIFGRLRRAAREAGGQSVLAAQFNVSPSFMSQVLNAKKSPTSAMLAHVGVKRVVKFVEAD